MEHAHDEKAGCLTDIISDHGALQDLGYVFDTLGNLTRREDRRQGILETFDYDDLNRLTRVTTEA
ncbi:hypothetical protein, partial [Thiolapillus sp.]